MHKPMRRQTPQQKKQDVYEKDHYNLAEMPHLFRKGKPRKKKGVNRQERSRARNLIRSAVLQAQEENLTSNALKKVAEPICSFPWKGALTVREIVEIKMANRVSRKKFRACKKHKNAQISNDNAV